VRRAALTVLVLLAALGAFLRFGGSRVPEGSLGLRLDAAGAPKAELLPGDRLGPLTRGRVVFFSADPETLIFPESDSYRMFDAEDRLLETRFQVVYAAEPGALGRVFSAVGEALRDSLTARLRGSARLLAATLDATRPGAADTLAVALAGRAKIPGVSVSVQALVATAASRLLFVGIDAGDWKNIDPLLSQGRMPNLARLTAEGVRADLGSMKPMLSPLLWTSIATGTTADRHGILDFLSVDPATGKQIPVTRRMRRVPAIWNYLTQAGVSQGIIAWLATWPAETISGTMVSDRFGYLAFAAQSPNGSDNGMTWPPEYAAEARRLEVHPADEPAAFWNRFMHLPETELKRLRSGTGFRKGDLPENLALTVSTALTSTAVAEDVRARSNPRFLAVYYELIDAMGHLTMPYAPPRAPGVSAEEFARYRDAMDAAYELQDELLGRLLAGIDDDTVVMIASDHGFRSGEARPRGSAAIEGGEAARWHRAPGMFVLWGPGVRRGVRLKDQPQLLDLAPTILALLETPVPRSMTGRFLSEAFTAEGRARFAPARVDTVVLRPEVWRAPTRTDESHGGPATAALHNNLGLVLEADGDLPGAEKEFRQALAAAPKDRLARTNLGAILIKTGRLDAARPILEQVCSDFPDNIPSIFNLGLLEQKSGNLERAEDLYRKVLDRDPGHEMARINLGHVVLRLGRTVEAETIFREELRRNPKAVNAHFGLGVAAAQQGRLEEAAAAFRKTLELDPNHKSAARNLTEVERALKAG